jgi:hypothetical protein
MAHVEADVAEAVIKPGLRMPVTMGCAVLDKLRDYSIENRKTEPLIMARENGFEGKTVAICGAGPSLETADIKDVDMVWACNSALPYLVDKGVRVAFGCAIDQTRTLLDEWADPPDVLYILATTVDPAVSKHLREHGRDILWVHNFCAWAEFEEEYKHYSETWPPGVLLGSGHTVVSRMIGVAEWMGFKRIDVYGADKAFGPDDITHANGTSAEDAYINPLVMEGEIDGRVWRTRADMLYAAVQLVRRAKESNGRIRLIGDTLPNALWDKSDDFLDMVARHVTPEEIDELHEARMAAAV